MNAWPDSQSDLWLTRGIGVITGAVGLLYNLDLPAWLGLSIFIEQYLIFLLYAVLTLIFLSAPVRPRRMIAMWTDRLLALACVIVATVSIVKYPTWVITSGYIEPEKLIVGALAILLLLEGIRRTTGVFLILFVIIGAVYAMLAEHMPGPLQSLGTSWDRIILFLFVDSSGLLGLPLWISATMAFGFVMFGKTIELTGAGDALNRLAIRAVGRYRGGPAYAAVLASGGFGGFTGSVAADIYVSGTFTIPLMKRVGFRPPVAGAIEAAASTGAGIMPPVMDPGAFLMAQTLGVPYPKIAVSAILPALLYYWSIWVSLIMETRHSSHITRLNADEFPADRVRETLIAWSLLALSMGLLIYTLFILYLNPALAAIYSTVPAIVLVVARKGIAGIGEILDGTIVRLRDLAPVTAGAGLIIGILSLAGLGTSFSQWAIGLSQGNPAAIVALTVLVTVVLGCMMPPFVVYAVSALILAPPLILTGAEPLAAHLFILYWSLFAQFTPPVCIAPIISASIAGANPWVTAAHTIRIGFAAFIIPFMFLYSPALLLNSSFDEIALITVKSLAGVAVFLYGFSNVLYGNGWRNRLFGVMQFLLALGILSPFWKWNLSAAGLLLLLWLVERFVFGLNRRKG